MLFVTLFINSLLYDIGFREVHKKKKMMKYWELVFFSSARVPGG